MSPEELRSHRMKHEMSRAELARLLGVTVHTIASYETGKQPIPPMLELAMASVLPMVNPTRVCRATARDELGRTASASGATLRNAIDNACQRLRTDWKRYPHVVHCHHLGGNAYAVRMGRHLPNGDVVVSPAAYRVEIEWLDHISRQQF